MSEMVAVVSLNVYAVNMKHNDNTVNIKVGRSPKSRTSGYHHGDLRTAALAAGMMLLNMEDGSNVGLREVARHVGVSATALYRHFPGKDALLDALAHEGMEQLAREQSDVAEKAGGGREGFVATGIAYIEFAASNPALFRLIFSQTSRVDLLEEDIHHVGAAMRGLRENIASLMPEGWSARDRKVAALHAWSLVHGLAMLVLDGQIAHDRVLIAATVRDMKLG